jgi:hypothetical protein
MGSTRTSFSATQADRERPSATHQTKSNDLFCMRRVECSRRNKFVSKEGPEGHFSEEEKLRKKEDPYLTFGEFLKSSMNGLGKEVPFWISHH